MNRFLRIICVFSLVVPVLSGGQKSVNLALETSVLFEPQDTLKHMQFIRDARKFLDTLEDALMPKKLLRTDKQTKSLTNFLQRLTDTILQLYEEDLETLFKVLENEMKTQFVKGSIFRDIVYDPKLQTFFRNKLKEWANTDPRQMKAKIRQYVARDVNKNDTLHELARFLNDYYGKEQEFKMDEIIEKLRSTLDEPEIIIIVRDALNSLVLQHYDKMNYTTRAKLVDKINTIKHEYCSNDVDHDLKLTFRRTQSKKANSVEYMDAWLNKLEAKGAADKEVDLSDVDVQVQEPAGDKDAPVLTLDDWDNWFNKRNKEGIRKINTLMSDDIEEMIKATKEFKKKHKFKDEPKDTKAGKSKLRKRPIDSLVKHKRINTSGDSTFRTKEEDMSVEGPERINSTKHYTSKSKEEDGSLEEPKRIKGATDFQLRNNENDISIDGPEVNTKGDSKSRNNQDGFKKIKTTGNTKLRKKKSDLHVDEPDRIKTRGNSKLRKSKPKKNKTVRNAKLRNNQDDVLNGEPERSKTTRDSKYGNNHDDVPLEETNKVKIKGGVKLRKNEFELESIETTRLSKLRKKEKEVNFNKLKGIKKSRNSRLKNNHEVLERTKTTRDSKSRNKQDDESIERSERINTTINSTSRNDQDDVSMDKSERPKTTGDSKLRSNEDDEYMDRSVRISTTGDSKLRNNRDDFIDEFKRIKSTIDSKLNKNQDDVSIDGSERNKITGDSKLRSNQDDVSIDESERVKNTGDDKLRSNQDDVSIDESERVKNTGDSKLRSNRDDVSIDESARIKIIGDSKLEKNQDDVSNDDSERNNTTGDFVLRNNGDDISIEERERTKTTRNNQFDDLHEIIKALDVDKITDSKSIKPSIIKGKPDDDGFKSENDRRVESYYYTTKENDLKDKADNELKHLSANTNTLTTVEVFNQMYGVKPNKELIINKDLEIYVGGFDASLVKKAA